MYTELKSSSQLAIISPYSQQVKLLRDRFKNTFGVDSNKVVDITTVDGCQVNGSIFPLIRLHAFKISSCEIHQKKKKKIFLRVS